MTSLPYVIYGLAHPITGIVRYVGKSRNVNSRVRQGYQSASRIGVWLSALERRGLRPQIVILESGAEADWKARERYWIHELRASGHRLFNVCAGGNGSHGYRFHDQLQPEVRTMLGKVPDSHIAKLTGRSREAITYHRRVAGIPAAPITSRTPGPGRFVRGHHPWDKLDLAPEVLALLGQRSDAEIADMVGLFRSTIARRRRKLGIPACQGVRHRGGRNAKLTEPDVRCIRASFPKISMRALAHHYRVTVSAIHRVITRRSWNHVQ